jgi:excisionase family DNA binding protein
MSNSDHRLGNAAMKPPEPLAVRIPQAARLIGIGRSTIYQFINAGEIETIKVGRSTLIPTDSLRDFIQRRRDRRN